MSGKSRGREREVLDKNINTEGKQRHLAKEGAVKDKPRDYKNVSVNYATGRLPTL